MNSKDFLPINIVFVKLFAIKTENGNANIIFFSSFIYFYVNNCYVIIIKILHTLNHVINILHLCLDISLFFLLFDRVACLKKIFYFSINQKGLFNLNLHFFSLYFLNCMIILINDFKKSIFLINANSYQFHFHDWFSKVRLVRVWDFLGTFIFSFF